MDFINQINQERSGPDLDLVKIPDPAKKVMGPIATGLRPRTLHTVAVPVLCILQVSQLFPYSRYGVRYYSAYSGLVLCN